MNITEDHYMFFGMPSCFCATTWNILHHLKKNEMCFLQNKAKSPVYQHFYCTQRAWILFSKSQSAGLKHYTRYYKESLRLCVTKWWISSFISGGYSEVHIWLHSGEHFTGSTLMYAGCVLTLSLNDDLGKWVRGAARDSGLKNVYLRMTELRYVTALLSGGSPE